MTNCISYCAVLIVLALNSTACSSSMMSFHSPVVKKGGEIKGAVMAGSTGSIEIQSIIGLGYNMDASIKTSPFLPVSVLDKQISYPLDADLKYQIETDPLSVSAGIGWSSIINRRNTVELNKLDKNERSRLFFLLGNESLYGGIQLNYIHEGNSFFIGRDPVYTFHAQRYFENYIVGASIGTSFRLNPEIAFIRTGNRFGILWGMSVEFTGRYLD